VQGRLAQVVGSGICCRWVCQGITINIMLPTQRVHSALLRLEQLEAAEAWAVVVVEVDGESCIVQEAAVQYTEALPTLT
jgi:hypothetical protein